MSPVGAWPTGLVSFVSHARLHRMAVMPFSRVRLRTALLFRVPALPMKRYLASLLLSLMVLALSCAGPEQEGAGEVPSRPAITGQPSTPATAAPSTPIFSPTPGIGARGRGARLADGRTAPLVRVVPRDHIPAVYDPVHISVKEVGEQAGQGTPVIGVSIDGQSVAYPVAFLSGREIVNDTVGGTPIVVTW